MSYSANFSFCNADNFVNAEIEVELSHVGTNHETNSIGYLSVGAVMIGCGNVSSVPHVVIPLVVISISLNRFWNHLL